MSEIRLVNLTVLILLQSCFILGESLTVGDLGLVRTDLLRFLGLLRDTVFLCIAEGSVCKQKGCFKISIDN